MVQGVSVVGTLLNDSSLLNRNQDRLRLLEFRLASNEKFRELKFYGNDAPRIVSLKSDIEARDAYIRTIELTESITNTYDAVLQRMSDVADEVLKAADSNTASSATFQTDTVTIANNLFLEMESNLNLDVGGRFVFNGTRINEAPVRDMRTLVDYAAGDAADTIELDTRPGVANPDLPIILYTDGGGTARQQSYMAAGSDPAANETAGTANQTDLAGQRYDRTVITINDEQQVTYGITATNGAFQQLIDSVLRLRSAAQTGLTTDQRDTFLGEARVLAVAARDSIRQLQTSNGVVMNELIKTKTLHEDFININHFALEDITAADTNETALALSALTTQIESSFAAIARRNQLSLVNFI